MAAGWFDSEAFPMRKGNTREANCTFEKPAQGTLSALALQLLKEVATRRPEVGFPSPALRVRTAPDGIGLLAVPVGESEKPNFPLRWSRDSRRAMINLLPWFRAGGHVVPPDTRLVVPVERYEHPEWGLCLLFRFDRVSTEAIRRRGRRTRKEQEGAASSQVTSG